jgi:hypothetical protein
MPRKRKSYLDLCTFALPSRNCTAAVIVISYDMIGGEHADQAV